MPVTVYDIAREIGKTHVTVVRALRDDPGIAVATRKTVKRLAREMGYRPNLLARGLQRGRTHMIGVLVDMMFQEIASAKIVVLDRLATKAGYRIFLANTSGQSGETVEAARELIARGVDGIIRYGPPTHPSDLIEVQSLSVPTVFMDWAMPFECRQVVQDRGAGVAEAIDLLVAHGHRELCMLVAGVPEDQSVESNRVAAFLRAGETMGIPHAKDRVFYTQAEDHPTEDGHRTISPDRAIAVTRDIIEQFPKCTAILCTNDLLAITVLSMLARRGIRVPEDISVVGFDNSSWTECCAPSLTTVAQPIQEVIRAALDMLLEAVQAPNIEPRTVTVPSRLVVRESTGPVREEETLKIPSAGTTN